MQDSFLKAYKAQKSFRGNEAKTWMLTTVRNTAMDFLRRYKSSTTMTLDEPGYEPEDNSPDPSAYYSNNRAATRCAKGSRTGERRSRSRFWSWNWLNASVMAAAAIAVVISIVSTPMLRSGRETDAVAAEILDNHLRSPGGPSGGCAELGSAHRQAVVSGQD